MNITWLSSQDDEKAQTDSSRIRNRKQAPARLCCVVPCTTIAMELELHQQRNSTNFAITPTTKLRPGRQKVLLWFLLSFVGLIVFSCFVGWQI